MPCIIASNGVMQKSSLWWCQAEATSNSEKNHACNLELRKSEGIRQAGS